MPFITLTDEIETAWEARKDKLWWKPEGRANEPEVLLRQVGPNTFHVMEGFRYELPARDRRQGEEYRWDVPAHELDLAPDVKHRDNSTDLASIPPWLWWFIASHGQHTRAAVLHDHLIKSKGVPDERPFEGPRKVRDRVAKADRADRDKQADRAFRIALIESDVSILRSWIMWTAVSLASTARKQFGLAAVVAYGVHLAAFFASLFYWGFGRYTWWPLGWLWSPLGGGKWWPLEGRLWASADSEPLWGNVWLLPLILGLSGLMVWWLRWFFGVIGAGVVLLPTIVIWATYAVVWVLDWCATIGYRFWAKLRRLDVRTPSPKIGRPYRGEARPF